VASAAQFQGDGDQRVGVAIGADIGENNAQVEVLKPLVARNYEGNAFGPQSSHLVVIAVRLF
jgi:hypothetical protein